MNELTDLLQIPGLLRLETPVMVAVFLPVLAAVFLTLIIPAIRRRQGQGESRYD